MPPEEHNQIQFETSKGPVHINVNCPWEIIDSMEFEEGIGVFPHYRSIMWDKKHIHRLLHIYSGRIVIASSLNKEIIGYIAFSHPIPEEGWPETLVPLLYELGSIEVSRNWRHMGIAKGMLKAAMDDDAMNDYIVMLSGYSWHWDLDGTNLSKNEYRKMLMGMFASVGFRHYYTNEPNVLMDAANMLMARIGGRVTKEDRDTFIETLFSFKA